MTDEAKPTEPATLAFVDCETTSLDPYRGEVWEVAAIIRGGDPEYEAEHRWLLPVTLEAADPISLDIGGFHRRHPRGNTFDLDAVSDIVDAVRPFPTPLHEFAREFARLTHGAHLVGAVVSFDEKRLERILRAQEVMPSWHYHLIDVEALAVGYLTGTARLRGDTAPVAMPPWNSRELTGAMGVAMPSDAERHTAMGDARWAMRLYDAVMGG